MPQVNPEDGTVTEVDEIVVVGTRTFRGYYVYPPFPEDDNDPGPVLPDSPEAPDAPDTLDEDCRRQAALNRAALEAARLIGRDDAESGYLLVREADGSIRAIGPIEGNPDRPDEIPWPVTPASYGLSDFSQVVGLVHNHPRRSETGTTFDTRRNQFSQADANVTIRFTRVGVSQEFSQYIVIGDRAYQFGPDAEEGDTGDEVSPVQCQGAALS